MRNKNKNDPLPCTCWVSPPRVDPHVDEQLVPGVEWSQLPGAADPQAAEVLPLPLVHVELLYVADEAALALEHRLALHPTADVGTGTESFAVSALGPFRLSLVFCRLCNS
ncbi:hypothetical protein CEXT_621841 [Caerostris extrusa]|uniref:Uncharacterized protein n=1 Tax=Caerostris extrusa TaxID=172846 RepID=A0AAV4NB51_CAEEX|nr:hypothetical protein CEXT_621841 [Caerostris extrusa]